MAQTSAAELFAALTPLPSLVHGPVAYFSRQSFHSDDAVRVGAWMGLFDAHAVNVSQYHRLLTDCAFPAVRNRAFEFFMGNYERENAALSLKAGPQQAVDAQQDLLLADIGAAPAAIAEAQLRLYLATGAGLHLASSVWPAEKAWGARVALEWAVRGFAAQPFNAGLLLQILQKLDDLDDSTLTGELARVLAASPIHKPVAVVATALAHRQSKAFAAGLDLLNRLEADPAAREPLAQFQGFIQPLRARLLADLGDYRKSFELTARLNAFIASKEGVDRTTFFAVAKADLSLDISAEPSGVRADHIQMTGFPLSVSKALKSALSAHLQIDLVEDAPALAAARSYLERVQSGSIEHSRAPALASEAQRRYYEEIARFGARADATIHIDSAMLNSARAALLTKLFPGQRYIFCIRHPFDLILSCFRHRFSPTAATSNFHTIADAVRLYDFAMTQWFSLHSLNDPLVHYVRHEKLALDFQAEVERLLQFLGLKESAGAFESDGDAAPVDENQWKHYAFAFTSDAAEPLRKWTEFLGYETK